MKQYFKHIARKGLEIVGRNALDSTERKKLDEIGAVDKGVQILLYLKYRELLHQRAPLPPLDDVEFRSFSQNGEDGILLYLFSILGTTNKRCVEICAGDGLECNTANLIVNHGWSGLLFDGSAANVQQGREFYARCRDTLHFPPRMVHAWIDADNVNALVREHGFEGEIDLFSLDMDGIDYWVWQALDAVQPRVVVLEYNSAWGPDHAVTVPLRRDFVIDFNRQPLYHGASLAAFAKLGWQKGYRLVGCQRYGFNAFFVRKGIGDDLLPEVSVASCMRLPQARPDSWGDRVWVEV
jgi:hypothetical protein